MYNSTGEKARFGTIQISKVRKIMQYLVDSTGQYTVHDVDNRCRFDPHGGSLDPVSNSVDTGPPIVCIAYNLQLSVWHCRMSCHH